MRWLIGGQTYKLLRFSGPAHGSHYTWRAFVANPMEAAN
jgi:hypothetical protein